MARHPNEELLRRFYAAFDRLDAKGMAACYHPDATFSDPVFPKLRGADVAAMWGMLCKSAQAFELHFLGCQANDEAGLARWHATYVFSATGRRVHNAIESRFTFRNGLITAHVDEFDFWRWSRMALGARGLVLGWTPAVKAQVRKQAAAKLARVTGK